MMMYGIVQLKYRVLLMKEPAIILRLSMLISWSHHATLKQYTSKEVVESQVTKTSTVAEEYITIYKKTLKLVPMSQVVHSNFIYVVIW